MQDRPTHAHARTTTSPAPDSVAAPAGGGRRGSPHGSRAPARGRGSATLVRASGPRVSGVLLASSGDPAAALAGLAPDARQLRRDAVARAAASDGAALGWWLLGGLALAALLGLGAAREAGVRSVPRRGATA